jgi:hypothetical protein
MTTPTAASQLPHHRLVPEPFLVFDAGVNPPREHHPLLGLLRHGPYALPPGDGTIRIATITVTGQQGKLRSFLGQLRHPHTPTERKSYLPDFPGFRDVTRVDVVPARGMHVDLAPVAEDAADGQDQIVSELGRAVDRLNVQRDQWDVIVFLLPAAWEHWRTTPDGVFDLHDRLKALAAPLGIPVQMLREASALAYRDRASVAWRLSIALLVKAGGIPWRVEPATSEDTAYIGLSYAIRGGTSDAFVTCCSQVFDAEGGGMEFVAYNVGQVDDADNPHLTRDEMRAVMARSARLYQLRHAGRLPHRISVHKTTRWREDEIAGVFDAWSAAVDIECVTVQQTSWRAVVLESGPDTARSVPADWPIARGEMQQLSGTSALVWVNATAQRLSLRGGRYNPNVKTLPAPLLVSRDAGHGPLEVTAADLLALSTLDWNNDAPFDSGPVTIEYSSRLARTIAHVPSLPDNVYQYRLFM